MRYFWARVHWVIVDLLDSLASLWFLLLGIFALGMICAVMAEWLNLWKGIEVPTRTNFRTRRVKRRELAAEQVAEREKRGDAGQLARLEANGHGHCQEAERLRKKIAG